MSVVIGRLALGLRSRSRTQNRNRLPEKQTEKIAPSPEPKPAPEPAKKIAPVDAVAHMTKNAHPEDLHEQSHEPDKKRSHRKKAK
jgi:hypothetical protein